MIKLESWINHSLKMNPIIIPDTLYEIILTDGTILTGITHDIKERYFFVDNTKVEFENVHNFKFIEESFEQFKKRKHGYEDTLISRDELKGMFRDFKSFRGTPIVKKVIDFNE